MDGIDNRSSPKPMNEQCVETLRRTCAIHGLVIGVLLMIVTWFFPIPIAILVLLFDIKRPFGDIMLVAMPFILAIPVVGATIGSLIPLSSNELKTGVRREGDTPKMSIKGTFLEKR
jgi:hypothetical protein